MTDTADRATPGLDPEAVGEWLTTTLDGLAPPYELSLVAAGGSNLTYRVTDARGRDVALRRPPVAAVLATAHDMDREWRILDALHRRSDVPVPAPLAHCADPDVTGAPFFVMEFVDGLILRTAADAAGLTPAEHEAATASLVDVQVRLHAVDVDAVGLGDLSRHRTGYVERQLHRWKAQIDAAADRDLPLLHELHGALVASVPPESGPPALVHGDYRFDNTILGHDRHVAAVLDWELATIGDPVADLAWSSCYWSDPGDPVPFIQDSPTLDPGFDRREAMIERYRAASGRDCTALPWLRAFSYWKMGCIVEGVAARRRRGAGGGGAAGPAEAISARADGFLAHAATLLAAVA